MKKLLALFLAFALLLTVVGCGKKDDDSQKDDGSKITITAGEVRDKLVAATKKITDVKTVTNCSFTADIAVNSDGMSFDMSMGSKITMEYMVAGDPAEGYFKTTTVTSMFGSEDENVETVYVLNEDGEYTVYSHDTLMDEWDIASDYDDEYQDQMSDLADFSYLSGIAESDLTLAKKTESVDGHDTYVLSTTVSGEYLKQLGLEPDDLEIDISELSLPMTIYADTETFLPIRVEVGTESLSELLKKSLTDSMGDSVEGATFDASFENFVMDMSYDNIQIPALPEDALEDIALSDYDPQQADGSFVIFADGVAARIVCSTGWEGMPINHDYIIVCDEEYKYFLDFTIYPAMPKDELVETMLEDNYCATEDYTTLSPIGDYEVLLCGGGEDSGYYFAFTQMGDGWMVVYTYTFENEDMIPVLTAALPMAEEYPYEKVNTPGSEPTGDIQLTAAEVLDKLIEATDKENSRECISTCEMVFELSGTENGTNETAEISINIDCAVIVSADPFAGFTYGDITTTMMGQEQTNTVVLYVVEEDGKLIAYTQTNNGNWERTDATQENKERIAGGTSFHYLKDSEVVLDDSLETIDGKEMYVLYCEISGSELQNLGFDPSTLVNGYSGTTYPTALCIDTETFLPAYAMIDVSSTVEALKASFAESMSANAAEDVEVSAYCEGYFVKFSYGVPVPQVPTDAKTN